MTMSRIPAPFDGASTAIEERLDQAPKTVGARLPPAEVKATKAAAEAAGIGQSEWMREPSCFHLKRPPEEKGDSRSCPAGRVNGNFGRWSKIFVAAVDIPEETIQRVVKHANSIREGKAEEILKRLEIAHTEGK